MACQNQKPTCPKLGGQNITMSHIVRDLDLHFRNDESLGIRAVVEEEIWTQGGQRKHEALCSKHESI